MRFSRFFTTVLVAHLVGVALVYGSLPLEVPLIWNLQGDPEALIPRPAIWLVALIPVFAFALLVLTPTPDPRSPYYDDHGRVYTWGGRTFLAFYLLLFWTSVLFSLGISPIAWAICKSLLGFSLLLMGGLVVSRTPYGSVWFWSIRTPWTESDEQTWRRVHRLAGWWMVLLGLLGLLLIFAPRGLDVWIFLLAVLGYIALNVWASYRFGGKGNP